MDRREYKTWQRKMWLALFGCWNCCLASKYFRTTWTWMLWDGRWDWESGFGAAEPDDDPLVDDWKPRSFSIIWSEVGENTPFHVPKRCLMLVCTGGSTCLYALQKTYHSVTTKKRQVRSLWCRSQTQMVKRNWFIRRFSWIWLSQVKKEYGWETDLR